MPPVMDIARRCRAKLPLDSIHDKGADVVGFAVELDGARYPFRVDGMAVAAEMRARGLATDPSVPASYLEGILRAGVGLAHLLADDITTPNVEQELPAARWLDVLGFPPAGCA